MKPDEPFCTRYECSFIHAFRRFIRLGFANISARISSLGQVIARNPCAVVLTITFTDRAGAPQLASTASNRISNLDSAFCLKMHHKFGSRAQDPGLRTAASITNCDHQARGIVPTAKRLRAGIESLPIFARRRVDPASNSHFCDPNNSA